MVPYAPIRLAHYVGGLTTILSCITEPSKSTAVTATVGMGNSNSWMCRDHQATMTDKLY